MFEITQLKEKKLPELQEIAKELKIPRFSSLKKLDLIYQILDFQADNPDENPKGVVKENKKSEENLPKKPARTHHINEKNSSLDSKNKVASNNDVFEKDKNQVRENSNRPKQHKKQNHYKNNHHKRDHNGNKDNRNRYKEPDF